MVPVTATPPSVDRIKGQVIALVDVVVAVDVPAAKRNLMDMSTSVLEALFLHTGLRVFPRETTVSGSLVGVMRFARRKGLEGTGRGSSVFLPAS